MPFTPFHLGPGAAIKAAAGSRFSFMIFGGAQVLMDIEPLVRIMRQDSILHGPTHTLLGASVIGVVAAVTGKPITQVVLRIARANWQALTWRVAFTTAFVGTFSHILLDGLMHTDMEPLWPVIDGNPLLDLVPVKALHMGCVALGVLGLIWMIAKDTRAKR